MASPAAVAKALAVLAETFPKDITPEFVKIHQYAMRDVTDEQLMAAVKAAIDRCRFFPVPSELRDLAGVNRAAFVDTEDVLERIAAAAQYHPNGTRWPRVSAVRGGFGDAVAEAYGCAGGGDRLFSGNETTRAIARREFAEVLREAVRVQGSAALPASTAGRPALAAPALVLFDAPAVDRSGPRRLAAVLEERAS